MKKESLAFALVTNAISISEKDPVESLKQFNEGIRLMPDFLPAYNSRGILKVKTGDLKGAMEDYNLGLSYDSTYAPLYYSRGLLKQRKGDYTSAREDFQKAIEFGEKTKEVYWYKGLVEEKLRLFKEALEDYTLALEFDSKEASLYSDRGVVYDSLGLHKEALRDYDKALELNPDLSQAYCNKGILYSVLDNEKEAQKNYNKAIKINPEFDYAYLNRGISFYKMNKYDKASCDFEHVIKLNPDISFAYSFLAAIKLAKKETKGVLELLDKAFKVNNFDMFSTFYKAQFYKKTGEVELQRNYLRKTVLLQLLNHCAFLENKQNFYLYREINSNTIDSIKNNYLWFSSPNKLNDPLDSRFYQNITKDKEAKNILKEIRIRSLSKSYENYNHLLWGYYAQGSRGLVVEYELDIEKLIKKNIIINKVEYSNALKPQNSPVEFEDYGRSFFTKTPHWLHEEEWRLVTLKEALEDGHRLFDCFKIKSITFGVETSKKDKAKIRLLSSDIAYFEFFCKTNADGSFKIEKRRI